MKATIELEKAEIEMLRNALFILRETVRAQERIALSEQTDKGARDADRYGKQIRASLSLDDRLSDATVK